MASIRIGGSGVPLNLTNALGGPLPQNNITPVTAFNPTRGSNAVDLQAGQILQIPSGTFWVAPGPYTSIMWLDPVTNIYRAVAANNDRVLHALDSDGTNFALANLTGCAVGALITAAGSGFTNGIGQSVTGLTVTATAGGSVWVPVAGGAINSTVTITAAGTNYLYPPTLVFDAPPQGGIQATGYCTISGGVINAVTVENQGAGYVTAPNITLFNDPRDNTGSGGILTVNATLVGSGTITALYPSNYGTAVTSVPTFTFTANPVGSVAPTATIVMNFVVTGFTVNSGASGAAYGTSQPFMIISNGGTLQGTSEASNVAGPITDIGVTKTRMARIYGVSSSGGKVSATGALITDNGFGFQAVPLGVVLPSGSGTPTTIGQVTLTVGGVVDRSWVQPV